MKTAVSPPLSQWPPGFDAVLPYCALALAVLVCYGNVYDNAFLYDDKYLILGNRYLRSWQALGDIFTSYVNSGADRYGRFYRPLQNVLYLLLYQAFGLHTYAFHFLNVALHATNAGLVYALGRRLNFQAVGSFWATLIWAVHPVQTEAVTYMSATADTLGCCFCLCGLLTLLPDFTPKKIIMASGFMLLGLLSKETIIIFPLLAMSCRYVTADNPKALKNYVPLLPLFALAALYFFIRIFLLPFSGTDLLNIDPISHIYATHMDVRIYTFLATLPAYFGLLIWPTGLHMDRGFPTYLEPWHWEVGLGTAIVIAAALVIIFARGAKQRALSWGLLWAGIAHVPQTGILVPVNSLFLEHWLYLPSIGLMLGCGEAVGRSIQHPVALKCAGLAAGLTTLIFGLVTWQQNRVWHDAFSFYGNILAHGETSYRAHNNLGIAYLEQGDTAQALAQFRYNTQNQDYSPEAHQNIAAVYAKLPDGKPHSDEEIAELKRALEINPDFLPACVGLAQIYDYLGKPAEAAAYRHRADLIRQHLRP